MEKMNYKMIYQLKYEEQQYQTKAKSITFEEKTKENPQFIVLSSNNFLCMGGPPKLQMCGYPTKNGDHSTISLFQIITSS